MLRRLGVLLSGWRWVAVVIVAYAVLAAAAKTFDGVLRTNDERVYVEAGLLYLNGTPPYAYNFEHPPLAKYLIGLAVAAGLGPAATGTVIAASAALLLGSAGLLSPLALAALLSDPLLFSLSQHMMLDVFMLFFLSLGVLLHTRWQKHGRDTVLLAAYALYGAALASKLTALYPVAGATLYTLYHLLRRRGLRGAALLAAALSVAAAVFLASFAGDAIAGGPGAVLEHLYNMTCYMSARHSYRLVTGINGVTYLLLKTEIWVYRGNITFVYREAGNSTYVLSESIQETGLRWLYIQFTPAVGSIAAPYLLARALASPRKSPLHWSMLVSSLPALLHGPIWWYPLIPLALSYPLALHGVSLRGVAVLALVNSVQTLLAAIHILSRTWFIIELP